MKANRHWFEFLKLVIRFMTILLIVIYTIVVDWNDEIVNQQAVHHVVKIAKYTRSCISLSK